MKKTLTLVIILVLILIVSIFFLKSDQSTDEVEINTITSDDGKLILTVDPLTLPEGITIGELSIKAEVVTDFYSDTATTPEPLLVYRLEPDGLQLSEPATFTLTDEWQPHEEEESLVIPAIIHKSGDELKALDSEMSFNAETKTMEVSGEISHFSWLAKDPSGVFSIRLDPWRTDVMIDDVVPFSLSAIPIVPSWREGDGGKTLHYVTGDTWRVITNNTKLYVGSEFAPVKAPIPSATIKVGAEYSFKQNFTCVEEGQAAPLVSGPITFQYDHLGMIRWHYGLPPLGHSMTNEEIDAKYHKTWVDKGVKTTVKSILQTHLYNCKEGGWETFVPPPMYVPAGVAQ